MKRSKKRQILVVFVQCLLFVSLLSSLVFRIPSVNAAQSTSVTQILFVNSMNNASTQWQTNGNSPYLNNATGKHDIYIVGGAGQANKIEGNFGFPKLSALYSSITSTMLYVESGHNGTGTIGNSASVYNASGTLMGNLSPGDSYAWTMFNLTSTFNTITKINQASIYFKFLNVFPNLPLYVDRMYLNVTGTVYPQTSRDTWAQLLWNNDTAAKVNSTFPFVRLGSESLTSISQEELLTGALLAAQTHDNSSLSTAESVAVWLNQTSVKKHVWFTYNSSSGWQKTPIDPTPGAGVIERLAAYANLVPKWKPLLQQIVNEWIRIYLPLSTARVHFEVWPNDTVYLDPNYAYRDYCVASYQSSGAIAITLASAVLHNATLQNLAYRMIMNYTNYDPVRGAPHHLSTHAIYPNGTLDLSTYYFSKEDEDYANYMAAMETFYYYYPQNATVRSRIYEQAWDGAQAMWNSTGHCWNYKTDIRSGGLDLTSGPPYVAVHGFGMTDEVFLGAYLIFGNTTWRDRARQDFDSLVIQGEILTHGLIDHSTYHPNSAQEAWNVHGRRTAVILYNFFNNQTYLKWANMLFWNVTGQMTRKYGLAEDVNPSTGADVGVLNTRETVGEFLIYVNKTAPATSFHSLFTALGLPVSGVIPPPPPKWLSVELNSPNRKSQTSLSVAFTYTPYVVGAEIKNASLWTNSSGVWQRVMTNFTPLNLTQNSLSYIYPSYGTYVWNIRVYNSTLGAFASSNYTVSLMSVSVSPAPAVMDVGQSKLFTASIVGGFQPFTYQWYLNNTPISGATGSTWMFTPLSPGSYSVYVNATDSTGTTAKSNMAIVTVNPPPSVTITPASGIMDVGQSKLFTSNVTGGTTPFTYQWHLNDAPVLGATSSSWLFAPSSAASYTVYVKVTDYVEVTAKSNIALITVNPTPSVTISPSSVTLDVGQSQMFTSNALGGTPPCSYQWYINGVQVPSATNPTWTFVPSSAGSYAVYVKITDSVEFQVDSNTVTTIVNPPPSVSVSPTSAVMDVGQFQVFTSSVSGGTSPYSYQWYLDGSPVLGATSVTWVFTPSSAGSHTVYLAVIDAVSFMVTSDTVPVTVNEALSVSISPTSAVLYVGQSQLFISDVTGGTAPYTYQWYLNGAPVSGATSLNWTFTPSSAGSYTVYVEVTDNVGIQAASNIAAVAVNILEGHDVAVNSVTSSKTIVGKGFNVSINVTVANYGSYSETFMVTTYANTTEIASQNVTLLSGNSATITFIWNTTSFAYGNYTISAYAWPVPDETNTANNNLTGSIAKVTIPGDVTGDFFVDISDAALIGLWWQKTAPPAPANVDINGDGLIDIGDAALVGLNWQKHP